MPKFTHLVVDTSAFIKNAQLQDVAEHCYTVQGVVDEIKNDRQLKRLVVLPYSLQVREPDPDVLAKVTGFAKKTGDFASLSIVDLKVVALTYQLEKEHVGTEHLREEPKPAKTVSSGQKPQEFAGTGKVLGFYDGKKGDSGRERTETESEGDGNKPAEQIEEDEPSMEVEEETEHLKEKFAELSSEEIKELEEVEQDILRKIEQQEAKDEDLEAECEEEMSEDDEEAEQEEGEDDDEDDDEGWITPSNIKEVKRDYGTDLLEETPSPVACMTTDFAMQNVLKQIGLHIAALDGRVIKHARTYILRCYACFKTTSDSTKRFCPNCGNNTLKKVAVSLDADGQQVIHINTRRPLTARYKNRPVAKFDGGKHATNPLLFEDQPLPQQRFSAKAKAKTNALGDDYTAGHSPFVMRDVDSRSAVLRGNSNLKQWMKNYEYDNHRRGYKK
ncbi:RNA-binding protein NOB1 [Aedes albopictus]|uniref:RNA-binding protein NOB1 n=1 Tax=Aedes albopictus TaxID=7160 RepID=A0ABM1YWJ6_AEDAL|nr:RNA-binding protein NOB1-like [Aedes albopictus]